MGERMSDPLSNKWHTRMMQKARLVAGWSKDPSNQVGAVITDAHNRTISEGFNGPPRGITDDPSISRDVKLKRTLHAELNAILFARRDLTGATLYCTHHPCAQCAAAIVQSGISTVVFPENCKLSERWASDKVEARAMLEQALITIILEPNA